MSYFILYFAVTNFCKVHYHSMKTREHGTAESKRKDVEKGYSYREDRLIQISLSNLAPAIIMLLLTYKRLQLFKLV